MSAAAWPRRVAVVGAGTMGAGFAQIFALAGIPCRIADVSDERAETAREELIDLARRFEATGLLEAGEAERVGDGVEAAPSVGAAVDGADFVIEAVTEDKNVKRSVYSLIEAAAPEHSVVASNTSAIPICELAEFCEHPNRFLGTHWFNPPQWVPCVEVIPGPQTDAVVIERVHELLGRLGKRPVTVGDAAGFVANRIQFAMFREAALVVQEGIATAEQVDEVVRASFGFRLPFFGPFMIADMAGLDVYSGAYGALKADLGSRFSVPSSVRELVEKGRTGAKAGGGYFDWPDERMPKVVDRRNACYAALEKLLKQLPPPAPGADVSGEA